MRARLRAGRAVVDVVAVERRVDLVSLPVEGDRLVQLRLEVRIRRDAVRPGSRCHHGQRRLIVPPRVAAEIPVRVEDQDSRGRTPVLQIERRAQTRDAAADDDDVVPSAIVDDVEAPRLTVAPFAENHCVRGKRQAAVAHPVRDRERGRQIAAAQRARIGADDTVAGGGLRRCREQLQRREARHRESSGGEQRSVEKIAPGDPSVLGHGDGNPNADARGPGVARSGSGAGNPAAPRAAIVFPPKSGAATPV